MSQKAPNRHRSQVFHGRPTPLTALFFKQTKSPTKRERGRDKRASQGEIGFHQRLQTKHHFSHLWTIAWGLCGKPLVSGTFVYSLSAGTILKDTLHHGLSTGHVIGRKLSVAPSGVGQQYKSICDVMAGETWQHIGGSQSLVHGSVLVIDTRRPSPPSSLAWVYLANLSVPCCASRGSR